MSKTKTIRYRPARAQSFKVKDNRGRYLLTDTIPFQWTTREPQGLAFRTREKAEAFIARKLPSAVIMFGLRVEKT